MTLECEDDQSQHLATDESHHSEQDDSGAHSEPTDFSEDDFAGTSQAWGRSGSGTLKSRREDRNAAHEESDSSPGRNECQKGKARRTSKDGDNTDKEQDDSGADKAHKPQKRKDQDEEAAVGNTPRRRRGQLFAPRRRTKYRRIPFMLYPASNDEGTWHKPEAAVTNWLSLFYNLLTGATLSAFYATHGVQTPEEIPSYFGYFTIVVGLWTTQLHYDLRFECNDVMHRLFKGLQILLFVYVAAASGGWDLTALAPPFVEVPLDPTAEDVQASVDHAAAQQSFLTVTIVTAAHCGVLGLQYLIVSILGRTVNRRTTAPRWSLVSLTIACIMFIASAAISESSLNRSRAKIALLYLGIFIQLAVIGAQALYGVQVPAREGHLSNQYGSLTMTILGFGFTNLVTAFQSALTGIGQAHTGYAQVFLCIGVLYLTWVFLFANFNPDIDVDAARTWLWELIHFPLHFAMLLLIASMVNTIAMTSWSNGLVEAYKIFYDAVQGAVAGTRLSGQEQWEVANYLGKLDLSPDFLSEYSTLLGYLDKPNLPGEQRNSTILVWGYQYLGQIVQTTCSQSSVSMPGRVKPLLRQLNLMGYDGESLTSTSATDAKALVEDILNLVLTDIYAGVLWMYAAAGLVLLLCALRSVERYKFKGAAGYVLHGFQFGGGTALCLLTLLDLGGRNVSIDHSIVEGGLVFENKMYPLAKSNLAVAVVFIVYAGVLAGSMGCMELVWFFGPKDRADKEVDHKEKSTG